MPALAVWRGRQRGGSVAAAAVCARPLLNVDRRTIGFVTGLAAEARLLRGTGFRVAVGGGAPNGARVAAERLVAEGARALVSFGLAGGLAPELRPGDVLVPELVAEAGVNFVCDAGLRAILGGGAGGVMAAAGGIIGGIAEKAALFASTGARAVDLESGAVARVAAAHGLPFAVLRAVADDAGHALPPAAMVALTATGHIDVYAVLRSVLAEPRQIKSLVALGRAAARARRALLARVQVRQA